MGLLNAVVTLASFVGILWGLSGGFSFSLAGRTYEIAGFMVWAAIAYCVVGSVVTHYIGRPQIALNFQQQRFEADFRHHMVRVREYSEAIALDKGEQVERQHLDRRFLLVLANYLRLIRAQKNLIWFTNVLRPGRDRVSVSGFGAAFFQRRDPVGRADADLIGLRPGPGLARAGSSRTTARWPPGAPPRTG